MLVLAVLTLVLRLAVVHFVNFQSGVCVVDNSILHFFPWYNIVHQSATILIPPGGVMLWWIGHADPSVLQLAAFIA